jgi:hypothetical protein
VDLIFCVAAEEYLAPLEVHAAVDQERVELEGYRCRQSVGHSIPADDGSVLGDDHVEPLLGVGKNVQQV